MTVGGRGAVSSSAVRLLVVAALAVCVAGVGAAGARTVTSRAGALVLPA